MKNVSIELKVVCYFDSHWLHEIKSRKYKAFGNNNDSCCLY